jgi:hypothetical protein
MSLSAINGLSDAPAQIEVFLLEKDTETFIEAAKHCEPGVSDDARLVSYLVDLMQPHLGSDVPPFLYAWLAVMASSAAVFDDVRALAGRGAFVIAGLERGYALTLAPRSGCSGAPLRSLERARRRRRPRLPGALIHKHTCADIAARWFG